MAVATTVQAFAYDIAVSCAGNDKQYATTLVTSLRTAGLSVFFYLDPSVQADLVGTDLQVTLLNVFARQARHCLILISKNYLTSEYTNLERQGALDRARKEPGYLIPVRLDDSILPGLPESIAYFDARSKSVPEITALTSKKLGAHSAQASTVQASEIISAPRLVIEKITDFDGERKRIDEAISLYEARIPREEQYDFESMVDLVRRHLSEEFGPAWKLHFLVATYGEHCVGMLVCYEDIGTNFAFIAYLAARNPRVPGKNPPDVSEHLAEGLIEERRRLGLSKAPRFLFEVDDPALAEDGKERRRRLGRLRVFNRFAPYQGVHLRALDLRYIQPPLKPPWTGSKKQLLLCYAAPGLHTLLPKSEVVDILTWTYTQLYAGDSIIEEPSARDAYDRDTHALLDSTIRHLPEQVRLLQYGEVEER